MPSKLAVDWIEVQRASEMGVDDETLWQDYFPEVERVKAKASIRKRREREQWATPAKLKEVAEIQRIKNLSKRNGNQSVVTNVTRPALESAAQAITRLTDRNQLRAANAIDAALRSMEPLEISNPGELSTSIKLLRLMDGRDREGNTLALNLGAFWSAPQSGTESAPAKAVVVDV